MARSFAGKATIAGAGDRQGMDGLSEAGCRRHWEVAPGIRGLAARMPVSTDLATLGLEESDVDSSQSAAEKKQLDRRRQRTLISFARRELSALESGYQDIVKAVQASLGIATGILAATDKQADLAIQDEPAPPASRSRGGGTRRPTAADEVMSDEQRRAVGLIGELLAYEWLKQHYQRTHRLALTDSCWVSFNGTRALGIGATSDDFGFDFRVELRSTRHYWEVKATSGDTQLLELGPTELAAAQRFQRDRADRYRILYITNALEPAAAKLHVLPNPFSRQGAPAYRVVGGGSVKYKFELKD